MFYDENTKKVVDCTGNGKVLFETREKSLEYLTYEISDFS